MMKFYFCDKTKVEMNIITDLLSEENIPYKIKKIIVRHDIFDEDDEEDEEDFIIVEELYNIEVYTDLIHFDFIKHLADKKIDNRIHLERSFLEKVEDKNVLRLHKETITNTNKRNKSK